MKIVSALLVGFLFSPFALAGPEGPVCDAGGPYTEDCEGATTRLLLDGSGSTGDEITFKWTTDCTDGTFNNDTLAKPALTVNTSNLHGLPLNCKVTLVVTDAAGDTDECSADVTITPHPADVFGDKTVSGDDFTVGQEILYKIVLRNEGDNDQPDNSGDEFSDTLPDSLELLSASASSGTIKVDKNNNLVTWNGVIPENDEVTIKIRASIEDARAGDVICNQGHIHYDASGCGINDGYRKTDDPTINELKFDPTCFTVRRDPITNGLPTLSEWGIVLLSLALGGVMVLKRMRMGVAA